MKNVFLKWINLILLEITLIFNKRKRTNDNVIRLIINRELCKYGVDYDYVKRNRIIDGLSWYEYYKFKNPKEYISWEKYSIRIITTYYGVTREKAKREFSFISLNYSLFFDFDYKLLDNIITKNDKQ